MKRKISLGLCIIFVLLVLHLNLASVADLVDNYDFSLFSGDINVTSSIDTMLDSDSNGVNDTLSFDLNIDINVSDNYFFQILIKENNFPVTERVNKTFNSSGAITINISTKLLTQNVFNYSVRIYDSNNRLVYRQDDYQTENYTSYEKGVDILSITDENVNIDFIRINLSLNVTDNSTDKVTVALSFNNNSIASTKLVNLTVGTQIVSIDFDNETIKSTHFNGSYLVDSVTIGGKSFDTNHTTAVYDYEDFAKTTYIKDFTDRQLDEDDNNLSEYLEVNVTIEVKSDDNYTINYELFDEFDNFVTEFSKNITLTTGNNVVQTLVNGSEIYKSKVDGPYVLEFVSLSSGNDTVDVIFDAYTTNLSFFDDFERPPLPDLNISIVSVYNSGSNVSYINVTVANAGDAPAFDIFVDVFDNESFSDDDSTDFVNMSDSIVFTFTASNSTNSTDYIAIVDFDNLVDESDESNNIASTEAPPSSSISVSSFQNLSYSAGKVIFEAVLSNDGDFDVFNISWSFDPDDGNPLIYSEENFSSLTSGDSINLYVEYDYGGGSIVADPNVTVNAKDSSGNALSDWKTLHISIGDLIVSQLSVLYVNSLQRIFEFLITNNLGSSISNVAWSMDTGEVVINSESNASLSPGETMNVFVEYNYSATGSFNVTANASNGTLFDEKVILVEVS